MERKAKAEQRGHAYQNRTGDTERKTTASEVVSDSEGFSAELSVGTQYASYVNNRGLMRIDERAEQAEREILFMFDDEADKLEGT